MADARILVEPKNLLITGGAGFIGSMFVEVAVEAGCKVIVLDVLTYAGSEKNLTHIKQPSAAGGTWELVQGSINDGALVSKLLKEHKIDSVVHMAAESHVDNSIAAPGEFIQTNIIGTYTLLEASRQYYKDLPRAEKENFRFAYVSTDEVYGSLGETGKFMETTQIQPNSPYSASKAAGDHLVRAWYHTYGLPTVTTHCSNNYGPRQYPEKLIPVMVTRALAGQSLPIYGDGKNIRDWIHVEDHARGVWDALTKGALGEAYNFGGNAERTNIEMVHTLCDIMEELAPRKDAREYRSLIAFVPDRLGHDRRYAIDDRKAIKELSYKRRWTFEAGMKATVEWYLNNKEWCDAMIERKAQKAA